MTYEKDRSAVFQKMGFENTIESFFEFLDAIVVFFTNHPDRPILNENLTANERETYLGNLWGILPCRYELQFSALVKNAAYSLSSLQLPIDRLRVLLRGCHLLRLDLYSTFSSIGEEVLDDNDRYFRSLCPLACEHPLEILVHPSLTRNVMHHAQNEYTLED